MAKKRKSERAGLRLEEPTDKNAVSLVRAFVDYSGDDFRFEQHVSEDDREFMLSVCAQALVKGFNPSPRQLARAARVVRDLNRSASRERIYQNMANKPPSKDPQWMARRAAKLRVWEGRLSFSKQFPSDDEIIEKLCELGLLPERSAGQTAISLILAWHKGQQSGAQPTDQAG